MLEQYLNRLIYNASYILTSDDIYNGKLSIIKNIIIGIKAEEINKGERIIEVTFSAASGRFFTSVESAEESLKRWLTFHKHWTNNLPITTMKPVIYNVTIGGEWQKEDTKETIRKIKEGYVDLLNKLNEEKKRLSDNIKEVENKINW